MAEERRRARYVRRTCGRSRRPTSTRTDYFVVHGRQPAGVAGQPARVPRRARRDRRASASGAARPSSSTPAAPAPPTRPTSGSRSCPAPTPRSCSPSSHVLFAEDLVDLGEVADLVNGVDDVLAAARRLHARGGRARPAASPAETIRRLAHEIAGRRPSAAVYGRIGLCNQEFGTLASWLVDVVNILTGNFDRAGGLMFGNPVALVHRHRCRSRSGPTACTFGRWRAACGARPRCSARCPLSCLAEEIATPGRGPAPGARHDRRQPGDLRARRRPPRRGAAAARVHDQRRQLANETTRHAHVILPGPVGARAAALRRADLVLGGRARAGNFSPAVFPPRRPARTSGRSSLRLGAIVRGHAATTRSTSTRSTTASSSALVEAKGLDPADVLRAYDGNAATRAAGRSACSTSRSAPARSATATATSPTASRSQRFEDAPHGIDLGPDGAARRRDPAHAVGQDRARARRTSSTTSRACERRLGPRRRRRSCSIEPPPRALEQLVDAQRQGAREGQGPLHAAHPSRRRGAHRASTTAALAAGHLRSGHRSRCRSR